MLKSQKPRARPQIKVWRPTHLNESPEIEGKGQKRTGPKVREEKKEKESLAIFERSRKEFEKF